MNLQKVSRAVTPAKAEVRNNLKRLDSGFHRNDEIGIPGTF
jgi:hypothetical protein